MRRWRCNVLIGMVAMVALSFEGVWSKGSNEFTLTFREAVGGEAVSLSGFKSEAKARAKDPSLRLPKLVTKQPLFFKAYIGGRLLSFIADQSELKLRANVYDVVWFDCDGNKEFSATERFALTDEDERDLGPIPVTVSYGGGEPTKVMVSISICGTSPRKVAGLKGRGKTLGTPTSTQLDTCRGKFKWARACSC